MFNEDSKTRADAILKGYGATHFVLMPDGTLLAASAGQFVPVVGVSDVQIGPTDSEIANEAIEKAKG